MRNYTLPRRPDAPAEQPRPVAARNTSFTGVCPHPQSVGYRSASTVQRNYEIVAVLANDVLDNPLGLSIEDPAGAAGMSAGTGPGR